MDIYEVIANAIGMEQEGHDFYMAAARNTDSEFGRGMFETLAADELRHKKLLQAVADKVAPNAADLEVPLARVRLKSVFAGLKPTSAAPNANDIEALAFAMGREKESYDMYKGAADSVTDPKSRAVFERMAVEENHHYEILSDTKYFLEQNRNWNIWEDGGPIEG